MKNTTAIEQSALCLVDEHGSLTRPARTLEPTVSFGISAVDASAAAAFVGSSSSDADELLQLTLGCAKSLAIGSSRERDEARIRLAARAISSLRSQMATLEIRQGAYVERGELEKAASLTKILDGISRRIAMWMNEHRLSTGGGGRAVAVAVAGIENVDVVGER